ncbi:MAG: Gfo/Idh/MocA family oxidoreductase [Phycisphaerae bacterium]|nr:Gfo/Idh/MocA family oxidoreductase [Phycisphaerae bacterium]
MIRFGGVGLRRGLTLLELLARHPAVDVVAVCDSDLGGDLDVHSPVDRLRDAGAAIEAAYTDFDRLLEHELDAVLIASPPPMHAAMSIAALEAGLHTLCEVPAIYNDLDEARALLDAARRGSAKYMMAENCCYWGFIQAWRRMVADGRIGRPTYAEAEYVHDVAELMTRPDGTLTWRASLYPLQYCTHGLGPLLDIMNDRVVSVTAMDTGPHRQPKWSTPDQAVGLFRTEVGRVIKILCSFSNARRPAHHYFSIYGTRGTLETSRQDCRKTLANFDDIPHLQGPVEMPLGYGLDGDTQLGADHGGADQAMLNDFVDCIIEDRPSPTDVVRSLEFSVPGLCACLSAESGSRPVDVPDYR